MEKIDVFSLISSLTVTNMRIDELMKDDNLALLVHMAKKDGVMRELSIPTLNNAWL